MRMCLPEFIVCAGACCAIIIIGPGLGVEQRGAWMVSQQQSHDLCQLLQQAVWSACRSHVAVRPNCQCPKVSAGLYYTTLNGNLQLTNRNRDRNDEEDCDFCL